MPDADPAVTGGEYKGDRYSTVPLIYLYAVVEQGTPKAKAALAEAWLAYRNAVTLAAREPVPE